MSEYDRIRQGVQQLVDQGRLAPGDSITMSDCDTKADFHIVSLHGATQVVEGPWGFGKSTHVGSVHFCLSSLGLHLSGPFVTCSPTVHIPAGRLLGMLAMALPSPARGRYLEEWRGELYDLCADGARWWRYTLYVLDILRGTPHQAIILRRRSRRAVE